MKSVLGAASALVVLLAVGACGQGASARSASGQPSTVAPEPKASHLMVGTWVNGNSAMLAARGGKLVAQQDGCVGLEVPGRPKPMLLRWPAGTVLSPDAKSVVGKAGGRLVLGKDVSLGGGIGLTPVPPECDASKWVSVFEVQEPI